MNLKEKFLFGCVPARLLLAYSIYETSNENMKLWTIPAILSTYGMLYKYKTYDDEQKGFFKQTVWWNNYRIFHIILYIMFIILILCNKFETAKRIPIVDLLIGLIVTLCHYS